MIWVRLLLLTSFLAQQTMCCCSAGCGAQNELSNAVCAFGTQREDQNFQQLETAPTTPACKHCHHSSERSENKENTADSVTVDSETIAVDGCREAPDSPHQHDHHLCVATHLFYIPANPVSVPRGIDFDGLYVAVLIDSEVAAGLAVSRTTSKRLGLEPSLPDRSTLQVYTL